MKISVQVKNSFFALILLSATACDTNRSAENGAAADNDTILVTSDEQEIREFREWVNSRTNQADTMSNQRWNETKEEFNRRTAKLDQRMDSLSAKSRAEYQELKQQYNQWESGRELRLSMPLNADTLQQFHTNLLGNYANAAQINANNVKEVYVYFMEQVRKRRSNWSQHDWDYANKVYQNLNARKESLEENVATSDNIKIKALQTEFLSYEGAADVRDLGRNMR